MNDVELPLLLWTQEEFAEAKNNGAFASHGRVQLIDGMVWCEDHCADRRQRAAEVKGHDEKKRD